MDQILGILFIVIKIIKTDLGVRISIYGMNDRILGAHYSVPPLNVSKHLICGQLSKRQIKTFIVIPKDKEK